MNKGLRKAAACTVMAATLLCSSAAFTSCGIISTVKTISSIFKVGKTVKSATKIISMIGTVLGTFNSTTSKSSLVGTWAYQMPAIQFDSQSNLTNAGGVEASQTIADNLAPYFQKMGLNKLSLTLNEDNTAVYNIGGKTLNGTYSYDDTNKKLTLKYGILSLPAAYLSVVDNQMAMTFDSSSLNTVAKTAGLVSNQNSITAVSNLTSSHDGMKTGFSFVKE